MYIKDEELILERLQQQIDNGEDIVLLPDKFTTIIIIVLTFLLGLGCILISTKLIVMALAIWVIPAWYLFCIRSKDGQLIINQDGIQFFKFNECQKISWNDANRSYLSYSRRFYFIMVVLNNNQKINITRYSYRALSAQTIIKLFEKNFSKID